MRVKLMNLAGACQLGSSAGEADMPQKNRRRILFGRRRSLQTCTGTPSLSIETGRSTVDRRDRLIMDHKKSTLAKRCRCTLYFFPSRVKTFPTHSNAVKATTCPKVHCLLAKLFPAAAVIWFWKQTTLSENTLFSTNAFRIVAHRILKVCFSSSMSFCVPQETASPSITP
jgi:hypothetical protein